MKGEVESVWPDAIVLQDDVILEDTKNVSAICSQATETDSLHFRPDTFTHQPPLIISDFIGFQNYCY